MTPKKILLCTDFSENSKPAVRLAADYAASFGAKLVLFHVNDLNARPLPWFDDLVSPEDTLKNVEFACNRELKRLCEEIGKTLPSVTSCSAEGVPSTKIADFAKREGADLIVMGTHGWKGLNRLLKRSTADDVSDPHRVRYSLYGANGESANDRRIGANYRCERESFGPTKDLVRE